MVTAFEAALCADVVLRLDCSQDSRFDDRDISDLRFVEEETKGRGCCFE